MADEQDFWGKTISAGKAAREAQKPAPDLQPEQKYGNLPPLTDAPNLADYQPATSN